MNVEKNRIAFALAVFTLVPAVFASWSVDLPADAAAWEKTAAAELEEHLAKRVSDGSITVEGAGDVVFHIGATKYSAEKGFSGLKDEEWAIKSFGRDVVLVGGGTRGTLFAVYHFLEDFCGVRWWMDDETDIPAASPLALGRLDKRGRPFLRYREIYRDRQTDPRTAIRNRLNGNGEAYIPLEFGGGVVYGPPHRGHTFDRYLPYSKLGEAHPEWFSLVDGKRVGGQGKGQLCLSNLEMKDELVRRIIANISNTVAKARSEGRPLPSLYSISQNDNWNCCECDACRAVAERYGRSGEMLLFVNNVVGRVSKVFPGLTFTTAAYHYTEPPPTGGVCAASNLVINICNTRSNMATSLYDEGNGFFRNLMTSWRDCAKGGIFARDYAITFIRSCYGFPFPSEFYFGDRYRLYVENGARGFMTEHEGGKPEISDMYALKYHLQCRLAEDPSLDCGKLIENFMREYYGAGGDGVLAARRYLDRRRRETNAFVDWMARAGDFAWIGPAEIAEMQRHFDAAEAAVKDDPKHLKRVRDARSSVDRLAASRSAFALRPGAEESAGRPYRELPIDDRTCFIHPSGRKAIAHVKDPDAAGGRAVRISADAGALYAPPFVFGYKPNVLGRARLGTLDKKVYKTRLKPPYEKGYRWHSLGKVTLGKDSFFFFTRAWTLQIGMDDPYLDGKEVEVLAHLRVEGPKFFTDEKDGKSYVYIDRVILVDPVSSGS